MRTRSVRLELPGVHDGYRRCATGWCAARGSLTCRLKVRPGVDQPQNECQRHAKNKIDVPGELWANPERDARAFTD
ncbi:MAG: hypothetical protein SFZ23_02200 [Planctomycetota bacterium]|nr:hypothetical protein [Planctomycetota bacterium]